MKSLVEIAIESHGGIKRWAELDSVTAHLNLGGALWSLKGHPDMAGETDVSVGTRAQSASHYPFLADRARTSFEPNRVALERANGDLIEELGEPRGSFAGHTLETPWSKLQLAYFGGYAIWTYLNMPFVLARPDVASEESDPWEENGETWRRIKVRFPDGIATHCAEQTLYFDSLGLMRRHDYDVDISGGTEAARYTGGYVEAGGIMFPTQHTIFPRQSDNTPNRDLVVVSIEMSGIELK